MSRRNLIFSRYGLLWQCIKDDELASTAFGINTARMKLMAFTYGCFLAGIGGALYAYLYSFLHPSNFDFLKSIDFLIIVIVGGMGSITGTIYAGLLWVTVIEGLRIALPAQAPRIQMGLHTHIIDNRDDVEAVSGFLQEGSRGYSVWVKGA